MGLAKRHLLRFGLTHIRPIPKGRLETGVITVVECFPITVIGNRGASPKFRSPSQGPRFLALSRETRTRSSSETPEA